MYLETVIVDYIDLEGFLYRNRLKPKNMPNGSVIVEKIEDLDGDLVHGLFHIYNIEDCQSLETKIKIKNFNTDPTDNSFNFGFEIMGIPIGPISQGTYGYYCLCIPDGYFFENVKIIDPYKEGKEFENEVLIAKNESHIGLRLQLRSKRGHFSFQLQCKCNKNNLFKKGPKTEIKKVDSIFNGFKDNFYGFIKNNTSSSAMVIADIQLKKYISNFKQHNKIQTKEDFYLFIHDCCNHFKDLIENNGLFRLLFDKEGLNRINETSLQLLFFGIFKGYCDLMNIDMSREVESGRGPVDFKFSTGEKYKINIEMKFADNPKLKQGYKVQLPIYDSAEKIDNSIYLVVYTKDEEFRKIEDLQREELSNRKIFIINGTKKLSASKAKE